MSGPLFFYSCLNTPAKCLADVAKPLSGGANRNFHVSIRSEEWGVFAFPFGVPVAHSTTNFIKKTQATLIGEMAKVADKICNRMRIVGPTIFLEPFQCVSSPRDMKLSVRHVPFMELLLLRNTFRYVDYC
jgi:hypothetical protein